MTGGKITRITSAKVLGDTVSTRVIFVTGNIKIFENISVILYRKYLSNDCANMW